MLRALALATWSSDVSPAPRPAPDREYFGTDARPQDTWLAVLDGTVAGYVRIGPAVALESNRHVLEIKDLGVDPSARRRGIGRLLLGAAVEAAASRSIRRLTLRVLDSNAPGRALYASCGFAVEGVLREEFWLQGRYVDDILMARTITSHAAS